MHGKPVQPTEDLTGHDFTDRDWDSMSDEEAVLDEAGRRVKQAEGA